MQFRPDIQGLRAIAVVAVIIFHLNPTWLPGGFVGVDIFLVISGFLIGSILLNKKSKPDYRITDTLKYFYASRFKRIAPAYYGTLVLVSVSAAVLFLPADFSIYKNSLEKAAFFASNNYFAHFGDYFAPANHEQPLLHTWSLAVEIQFYLIAPFIFLLIPKRWLLRLLPVAIILLTVYAEYRLRAGVQQATYYSLIARLPAFFLGAWIATLISNRNIRGGEKYKKLWLTLFATGLVILAFIWPKPMGYFPGVAGLVPTAAAALLIWLNANNKVTAFLSNRTIVWVGTLSYSLYLWHWPILALLRYYTGSQLLGLAHTILFILLTIAFASASYYLIETPLRQKKSTKQVIGYAILTLFTVFIAGGMGKLNAHFTPLQLSKEFTQYAEDATICHGKIVGDCLRGDLTSKNEVLVLGDSHAAMLNHFFDYLGKKAHFKARIITGSSCVTIPGFDDQRIPEWAQKSCLAQIEEAKKYLKSIKTIFVTAMWTYQLQSEAFKNALSVFLSSEPKTHRVYVIAQIPSLSKNPQRSQRFVHLGLSGEVPIDYRYKEANSLLKKIVAQYDRSTKYLDFNHLEIFRTPPRYKDQLMYYDDHHLNQVGAVEYAREVESIFPMEL